MNHEIDSVEQLEAIYGEPSERALWKELNYLNEDYQAFVKASPFVVLASVGDRGTDCSPKGDPAGFVQILDERTLVIPDRPGNNRIDNLRNIIADPRVSLLFLIPGVGETLRVNGRARICVDPALVSRFEINGKLPRTVIVVSVDSVYFHCAKAIVRSRLWDKETQIPRDALPSTGAMHRRLSGGHFDGDAYDRNLPQHTADGLY
ncbi:pyridoxamine 5'-phosphate oxidase family protein [Pandoraea nosoerga]|uniref:Pyridoxamine 5'-phosphate oxidase n=1 Tax=Pandoraea nosoerga TaxID=2508296 RepID=A0A5E4T1C4_9BURK|nr:pyridoxamine 5'-phosphate oxidase family protein [Pandoraea nosoerga]MBN4664366.1 pyridoxamine 5'-phosphate oxidase family protein [Pandoraea nosoerga]MBN4675738.1 pyridoxamine 5'-phosphate oxidase family protein [Pandoraea nosoerga]MBN4679455.1 pyridoxamine 5'-phosphate oxidase family protein [Pandoraea nosoerga]MBN4743548.1 pyridoxamine 5'-phosphate oxidase family protein [Pandoraea nosoerga]VVD81585.1 pyridoxamine 5'-phosphate oxidase [Pandoraea nosoerga]